MAIERLMSIDEVSEYLNIKKSTLYSWVESGEISHCRLHKLIRFKQSDIEALIEKCRVESIDAKTRAKSIMKRTTEPSRDIDRLVRNAVEGVKEKLYTSDHGKSDRIKGLRKEVSHGAL